ncbi:hypothetical protein CLIB1444_08S01508 [[Candida] jaroonii]|uniref:Uncharacterized protein n=1 Tax=[Candida] jaroonii TaxID=467808 RepID=A0ACA9YAK7_9ASCO|nr:hypothetical protein CLIB1444_08S01508 [[Candida] jaroonii]
MSHYNEVTPRATASKKWPDSLEEFVNRSFQRSQALTENDKLIFQQQIQHILTKAEKEGKLWINDWNQQLIPALDHNTSLDLICDGNDQPQVKRQLKEEFDSDSRKKQRMSRFNGNGESSRTPPPTDNDLTKPIVGRSKELEKRYYRLTSAPDPDLVRSQGTLQKSIQFILKQKETKPYSYIKDQFKSIRQDMTVQHIKNDFAMYVYETNSRIAIENNDLGEFNQCVTQLEYFFDEKKKRNNHLNRTELEFICYRLIYLLIVENHSEIFKFRLKLLKREYTHPDELEKLEFVNNAFKLQQYVLSSNYYKFFELLKSFEDLTHASLLINNFLIKKQRLKSLFTISKSYRILSIEFIISQLKFENVHEFIKFLGEYKLTKFIKGDDFDCVESRAVFTQLIANTNFKRIDIKGQV